MCFGTEDQHPGSTDRGDQGEEGKELTAELIGPRASENQHGQQPNDVTGQHKKCRKLTKFTILLVPPNE